MIYTNTMFTNKKNRVASRFLRHALLLLVLFIPLVLIACDDASSSSDGDGAKPEPAPEVEFTATVTDTVTTRSPNFAYQYVTFDIHSDLPVNVKLVLKEKGQTAPTRQEILNGAGIYRALDTEATPQVMAYAIDSKIASYTAALRNAGRNLNVIHDATANDFTVNATGNDMQNVDVLLLTPGTAYTLYAVQSDGPATTEVQTLIDLTTRSLTNNAPDLPAAGARNRPDLGTLEVARRFPTDIVFYDSRDAALILPMAAMNLSSALSIIISRQLPDETRSANIFSNPDLRINPNVCLNTLNSASVSSLLHPSFSSSGDTCKKTYNSVDYQFQYLLVHDPASIEDGTTFFKEDGYDLNSGFLPEHTGYTLQKSK